MREGQLQSWAIEWLCEQPSTVARNNGADCSGHVHGDPDVYGCVRGRMFVMEFKNEKGKLRPTQVIRLNEWLDAGAYAFVPRSRDDVREAWFVIARGDSLPPLFTLPDF